MKASWPTKKLGEIADCADGDWILSKDLKTGREVRLIQLGDIGEGIFLDKTDKWISKKRCEELNCTILKSGDILLARLGDPLAKACVFPGFDYPCITAVDVTIIRVGPKVEFRFLLRYLNSQSFKKQVNEVASGATRKRISRKNLENLEIPLPPLEEQKKIVEKIEKLFAKIDETSRLRAESSTASAALLPSALHQVFSRAEKEGWEMIDFQNSVLKPKRKAKGILKKKYQSEGKFPIVDQGQNLVTGYTDDESSVYNENLPVVIFGDHTRIFKYIDFRFVIGADGTQVLIPKDNLSPKYFYYALSALNIEELGYSRHFKILKTKKIPLPPIAEQKKIVAYLDSLSAKSSELQNFQNETASDFSALRQSTLAKAFAGGV